MNSFQSQSYYPDSSSVHRSTCISCIMPCNTAQIIDMKQREMRTQESESNGRFDEVSGIPQSFSYTLLLFASSYYTILKQCHIM